MGVVDGSGGWEGGGGWQIGSPVDCARYLAKGAYRVASGRAVGPNLGRGRPEGFARGSDKLMSQGISAYA